ncbi:MAG: glycosyltransferase family 52 protein [Bacteroides uniformis]|jgi:hypothetical protein|uniref:Glycosyltransferase family 52 n=1 Tax=Bacteroides parvus TaxID=2763025 RepID=A0ABR7C2P8_9BACE|nr:glycosyltransferase family 52 [Bacteroides parvus]MBC5591845.1 hypothetical protein [Bacteroides parvus]MCI7387619.1 glycosyltransferase family 52 protein [Bacteroides uniformis]
METRKYSTICCADSVYGLFLYFLIMNKEIENTHFFFSKRLPKVYRDKLLCNGTLIKLPRTQVRFLHYIAQLYYCLYIPFVFFIKHVQGARVYGFDFLEWTNPIMSLSKEFNVIEDGFGNYTMPQLEQQRFMNSWWRRMLISKVKLFHLPYGLSDTVKNIYLTGIMPIPEVIEDKVCMINIKDIWKSLPVLRRQLILNFFGIDKVELKTNRTVLLLTQCWSEENIMSEKQKIEIYSRIISLCGEKNILLKTHPREKTNYKQLFPDLEVISEPIPFQLLDLLEFHFEVAVTINSTAIFSLSDYTRKIVIIPEEVSRDKLYSLVLKRLDDKEFSIK